MNKLYLQTKFGLKEIVHIEDAAKLLKIKQNTLSAYLTREQIYIKKVRVKNLTFFYREDIDKLIKYKSQTHKNDSQNMLNLFENE